MPILVPRFDFRVQIAVAHDVGKLRDRYEDAWLSLPEQAVFCVADGMGGHNAGEVAAKIAVDEVRAGIASERSQHVIDAYVTRPDLQKRRNVFRRLRRVVERANERVREEAQKNEAWRGMGTTLDLVWLARNYAFVAHAGDSRVYLARSRAVLQLTQDHAQLESLKAAGELRPSRSAPRNPLLNAVGLGEAVTVDTLFVDLARHDRLLLCTDGLHGQLAGEAELSALLRSGTPQEAADNLIERAAASGRDNATAVLIEVCDRFVRREVDDKGVAARDLESARQCALLADLPTSMVLGTLAAAVEIELDEEAAVPRVLANDLVAYIILDGTVRMADERRISTGGLLYPESLVGAWSEEGLSTVEQHARLLRLRADDFAEIASELNLGVELYRRLAGYLARLLAGHARPTARH